MRVRLLGVLTLALAASAPAYASWPMARHDSKRSGTANGSSNITKPVSYWRTYLGGGLTTGQLLAMDVNGDGNVDLVTVTGGTVVARSPNDEVLWKTPPRGIVAIAGVGDLDGDGNPDIVAQSTDHVYIASGKTGALEWVEPDGEIGTMGSVRVGDVTGDGKADLVITECGCCGVNSGKSGFIYSFGAGFGAATQLGVLPVFACGSSYSVTLADADATTGDEILVADYDHFALLNGNGNVIAATAKQGTWVSANQCLPVDLDGQPGAEFVCLLNSSNAPQTNQRKLSVLHFDAGSSTLSVLWSTNVAPDATGDMRWVNPVVDLDGDGTYEIVLSTHDPQLGWQTRIFDALGGAELVTPLANAIVQGEVALEAKNKLDVLTSPPGTNDLTAWSFTRTPQPSLTQRWTASGRAALTYADPALLSVTSVSTRPVALDVDGDGVDDIVTRTLTSPSGLAAYSGIGGTSAVVGTFTLAAGTDPGTAWVTPGVSSTSAVALVSTDGVLSLLGSGLQPAHRLDNPAAPIAVQVGGYFASGGWRELSNAPRTYPFDGKADAILVPDSRRALNRFDAQLSSWAIPPKSLWSVTHTYAATIVPNLDGTKAGAACLALQEPVTSPPQYRIRALRADGSILWDTPMDSNPIADIASGDFNGDGVPDFALQWNSPSSTNIQTKALSGKDGSMLWQTQPVFPGLGGFQSPGISVGRFGTDAIDDIYYQGSPTRVLSGLDGNEIASGGLTSSYGLPVLVDINGDGTDEVVLTAGFSPTSVFSHNLSSTLWTSTDDDRPYPYGGIAHCGANPTVPTLVEGSWAHPARLKFTALAGSLGKMTTVILAGGKVYPDENAAKNDGAYLGQLSSANVHPNLTGKGRPTALVGSFDGWLYGVNPCDATLDFAVNIGSTIGEVIFGDTDGDGRDEMLVTAADGFLYDLKHEAIEKPSYVWDTDPQHGVTDHDIDTIETTDSLSATWAPVAGSTGYEVTVVTKDGTAVPTPVWKNVGNTTSATLSGLPLVVGTQYFFAVRALSANGPSVDAMSNGVVVTAGGSGDAGADGGTDPLLVGGCGCRVSGSRHESWTVGAALAGLLFLFGARRHRRRRDRR